MSVATPQMGPSALSVADWQAMHAASAVDAAGTLSQLFDQSPAEVERLARHLPVGGGALLAVLRFERAAYDSGDLERIAEADGLVVRTFGVALAVYARTPAHERPDAVRVLHRVPAGSLGWEDLQDGGDEVAAS